MKMSHLLARTAALAGLSVLAASAAHAQAVSPRFLSATGRPGNVSFNYQLFLGQDTRVTAGNMVTFYDFNGLLFDGANAPTFTGVGGASYALSMSLLGVDPPGTAKLAGDDPTLPNVTLTYNGATLSNTTTAEQNLGILTLHSTNPMNMGGDFTPFAANSTKISNGFAAGNQSFVSGPNNAINASGTDTPEPGTLAMFLGMGLTGATAMRRRLRRK